MSTYELLPASRADPERIARIAAERDYDAEMKLPEGKRCDDCRHAQRCFGFGFTTPGRTSCDFWPSRFLPVREPIEGADQ